MILCDFLSYVVRPTWTSQQLVKFVVISSYCKSATRQNAANCYVGEICPSRHHDNLPNFAVMSSYCKSAKRVVLSCYSNTIMKHFKRPHSHRIYTIIKQFDGAELLKNNVEYWKIRGKTEENWRKSRPTVNQNYRLSRFPKVKTVFCSLTLVKWAFLWQALLVQLVLQNLGLLLLSDYSKTI